MGGIIGVKPIIYMSSEGKMGSIDKARGSKNTIAKIIDYMRKLQDNIKDHEIVIGHADAPHMVEELKEAIVKEFGDDLRIVIANVNPTAGSHCGPDTVGVVFHGIHR
ncbi:MAG: DegV family protein [Bacilli bacterium]|nr:DegV family protein [Bacilli bacterium]